MNNRRHDFLHNFLAVVTLIHAKWNQYWQKTLDEKDNADLEKKTWLDQPDAMLAAGKLK